MSEAAAGLAAIPHIAGIEPHPLAVAMRESLWLYPTVESLHIAGIAGLFGTILLLDLRLLGLGASLSVSALMRLVVPMALVALGLVVATGSLMFIAHAHEFLASPLFVYKLGLIMLLLTNALVLHLREPMHRRQGYAPALGAVSRIQVLVSMLGWLAVIGLGRWLAYV
ncbi:MAG: hypothetical protein ACO3WN_00470 [Burkholderiaceae bacterium]